jgi:hypothetical protein
MSKNVSTLPRVGHLSTLGEIRREMVRIYRAVRRGDIESQEGTRLIYMLQAVGKLIDGSDLSKRLDDLERGHTVPAIETNNVQEAEIVPTD